MVLVKCITVNGATADAPAKCLVLSGIQHQTKKHQAQKLTKPHSTAPTINFALETLLQHHNTPQNDHMQLEPVQYYVLLSAVFSIHIPVADQNIKLLADRNRVLGVMASCK